MLLKPAIFLDRDGTLIQNVLNPSNGQFESPYHYDDVRLLPDALSTLLEMQEAGYLLFLISNQPSYAKGTCSFSMLQKIHQRFLELTESQEIHWTECYYCYHHPNAVVSELKQDCDCRKPGTYFLQKAAKDYHLALNNSWLIGDRISDVESGKRAGLRTILLPDVRWGNNSDHISTEIKKSNPDFYCTDLSSAYQHIKLNTQSQLYSNHSKEKLCFTH